MARWKQEFDDHPIHQKLNDALKICLSIHKEEISPTAKVEVRRFLKIMAAIETALKNSDTETVSKKILEAMINGIERAKGQLNEFMTSRNEGHLTNANDVLSDDVLQYLAQLKSSAKGGRRESPLRSLEKFVDDEITSMQQERDAWKENLRELTEQKSQLHQEIEQLSNVVNERQAQITDNLHQFQNQFSEDQNTRKTQFSEDRTQRESSFTEDQTERANQFTTWISDFKNSADKELGSSFEKQKLEIDEQREQLTNDLKEILDNSTDTHTKILELYGLAAGDSVGAGFEARANDEKESAKKWDKWAGWTISITVVWGILSYVFLVQNVTDISQLVINLVKAISITGVLVYGMVFCSRRASMHYRNEAKDRWFAQQMAAIKPFSAILSEERRPEFIYTVGDRVFGQQDALTSGVETDNTSPSNILGCIIKELDVRFADLKSLLTKDSQ